MKVLIIDNYDSFTFNLYQYIGEILTKSGESFVLDVVRNDAITLSEIMNKGYKKIILSPGPGDPRDKKYFGICFEVIKKLGKQTPILGVCLGVQGIAAAFGGNIIHAEIPMHGKTSLITHTNTGIFAGLPQDLAVMRYHSLIIEKETLPESFEITAVAEDTKEIMGLRHKTLPIEGVQFHPESFATEGGKLLLANFLFENKTL
jgi:anthranilate synthase component 2